MTLRTSLLLTALTVTAACSRKAEPTRAAPEPQPVALEAAPRVVHDEADAGVLRAPEPAAPVATSAPKPAAAAPVAMLAPKPVTARAAPKSPAVASLRVRRAVMGTGVEQRTPQGVAGRFGTDVGTVFAYVEVANPGEPTSVTMVWKKAGVETSRIDLRVGHGKGWRTWSKKRIGAKDAGEWTVDVLTVDGRPLRTLSFVVVRG